ncbi:MAG TPA: HNH endonuclease signature motif containing protein, partial [Streptosporangiaceae bacterium]|nr:HNH endonuclease signature motif containing protein [Streptosporangiaceae bacterium]
VTVTDQHGRAVGHGCGRPMRSPARRSPGGAALTLLERDHGPPRPGRYGRWRLRLSNGREFTVDIGPVPVASCDHRDASPGYRPGTRLRHLVEIRDGECTAPACRHPAQRCDFEHAVPWDQGGRTCACNTGPVCRHHHQAKQSPGWRLDQPEPGRHTWTTPSGRSYTSEPATYPV